MIELTTVAICCLVVDSYFTPTEISEIFVGFSRKLEGADGIADQSRAFISGVLQVRLLVLEFSLVLG